jgi:aldehyde dehydrogenase family 7 protein A1
MGLDFESSENKFLTTLGLEAHNIGSYVNGKWKANGPTVTSVNPSTGKVGGTSGLLPR